jgi:SAM-dependent methyltransferase
MEQFDLASMLIGWQQYNALQIVMPGLNEWLSVARSADAEDVRERILSGYKDGKPFTPYVPTIALPSPADRVLDFGCGLGRNFPYLRTVAHHITGFDLPPMIERFRTVAGDAVDTLSADWNDLRENRFDLIFAALVLQHIEPEACQLYLMDFLRMAPAVYLLTRADNDFGPNVIDLIAQTGGFEAGDCALVDHDPGTNQLRVLGHDSFDALRRAGNGHCEVLLRSKVFRPESATGS